MRQRHLDWIDWMKASGMLLILVGHLSARWNNGMAPPIFPKQLGVAFFLFATGFTLARETRPIGTVLFKRLSEVFLYGLSLAVLIAIKGLIVDGDAHAFNFLPFALGVNVLFDHFPPNPTTWYVGSYIHVLLLWAVFLRHRRVSGAWLLAALVAEVAIRSVLMDRAGLHIAYMLISNWATVFLLGMFCGQEPDEPVSVHQRWLDGLAVALMPILAVWPWIVGSASIARGFPFMRVANSPLLTSSAISFVYVAYTWAAYRIALRLPSATFIRFVARNTLIIFLAHMPLYFALNPVLRRFIDSYNVRAVLLLTICTVGLGYVSEWLRRDYPRAINAIATRIAPAVVPTSARSRSTRSV
jgi:hypothetical protein